MNKNTKICEEVDSFMLINKRVVLAYSGSLDTSIAVQWLKEEGYDVVAVFIDTGHGKDIATIKVQAIQVGAVSSYVVYAKDELSGEIPKHDPESDLHLTPSVLSLLSNKLVEIAGEENAIAIAHGSKVEESKGVSFKSLIHSLDPKLKVYAPVQEWNWSLEEKIAYAAEKNIAIPIMV